MTGRRQRGREAKRQARPCSLLATRHGFCAFLPPFVACVVVVVLSRDLAGELSPGGPTDLGVLAAPPTDPFPALFAFPFLAGFVLFHLPLLAAFSICPSANFPPSSPGPLCILAFGSPSLALSRSFVHPPKIPPKSYQKKFENPRKPPFSSLSSPLQASPSSASPLHPISLPLPRLILGCVVGRSTFQRLAAFDSSSFGAFTLWLR